MIWSILYFALGEANLQCKIITAKRFDREFYDRSCILSQSKLIYPAIFSIEHRSASRNLKRIRSREHRFELSTASQINHVSQLHSAGRHVNVVLQTRGEKRMGLLRSETAFSST